MYHVKFVRDIRVLAVATYLALINRRDGAFDLTGGGDEKAVIEGGTVCGEGHELEPVGPRR